MRLPAWEDDPLGDACLTNADVAHTVGVLRQMRKEIDDMHRFIALAAIAAGGELRVPEMMAIQDPEWSVTRDLLDMSTVVRASWPEREAK